MNSMTYKLHRCIIRESEKVRKLLNKEFDKRELSSRLITNDARKEGRSFTEQTLCRFRKHGNVKGSLATDDIMYLCDKFGIELTLKVKKISNGKYLR